LEDKLKAFELGADDYLEKPFQPEELVARLAILMRRGQAMKIIHQVESDYEVTTTLVTVHSLRGGVGCSSLAVNLALAFHRMWGKSTLLVDAVLTAGQVALMLDSNPRVTWEDFVDIDPDAIDKEIVEQMTVPHESGIRLIASPKFPIATDSFTYEFTHAVMQELIRNNEFIVVDAPHDFSDMTIEVLNISDQILLVFAPEMASLRAAVAALDIYDKLGFSRDKIKITLNHNANVAGIRQPQIEKVLDRSIDLVVPFGGTDIIRAINFGEPFLLKNPESPVSTLLEDTAYNLANQFHKNIPPVTPTATWKRVTKRLSTEEKT
jgi:pilus assembly protein CpaE